jgi:mercuric ion transport protein
MAAAHLKANEKAGACGTSQDAGRRLARWTTAGGMLAALGICAACCLLPFVLLTVGVAGAWVSALDSLAPYKWIFIAVTVALLGYGLYFVYWKAKPTCAAGSDCKTCRSTRSMRVMLWVAVVLAMSGLVFERIEPMLT